MAKYSHFYLIHFQYLGFRYHGWYKQPDVKTVQLMVERTVRYVLDHDHFKVMGSSRTDAMVSANHSAFELFLKDAIDKDAFVEKINLNLPPDIRILELEEVDGTFNIIRSPKLKEYLYLFSFGEKPHPFASSLMTGVLGNLDIELMKKGARLFEGEHNFVRYCTKPSENTQFVRSIDFSSIEENNLFTANFFPEKSYVYHIHGTGFMRYQVRLIMGQLLKLGRNELTLDEIAYSLTGANTEPLAEIAPPSGLILNKIHFNK